MSGTLLESILVLLLLTARVDCFWLAERQPLANVYQGSHNKSAAKRVPLKQDRCHTFTNHFIVLHSTKKQADGNLNERPPNKQATKASAATKNKKKPNLDPLAKYTAPPKNKDIHKEKIKRRNWEESYGILLEYYKEHGNANVPHHYKKDPKLGVWVQEQRKRRGSLPADKFAKLDALNFTWDGVKKQKADEKWEEMFQSLKEYKKEEGHCNVPGRRPQNQRLSYWVEAQRTQYRQKRKSLTPERIQKLESIGFVWRLIAFGEKGTDDGLWNKRYRQLIEYKKKNGDCNVPFPYKKNPALGNWVNTQRKWQIDGILLPHRKEQLDDIGFEWDFIEIWDQAWQIQFNALRSILDAGHIDLAAITRQTWAKPPEQKELWNWELNQQHMLKRNTLNSTREAMLDELGYWESLGLSK